MHDEPPPGALKGRFTLRWTPPPGWPDVPEGFRSDVRWEPDPYWPKPDSEWRFWQVDGEPSAVEYFARRDQTSEAVRHWVAPPGWPQPPADFVPADNWEPDPRWPRAPEGWQFWQVSDDAMEAYERELVATRSLRLRALNIVEGHIETCREYRADLPAEPQARWADPRRTATGEKVARALRKLPGKQEQPPNLHTLLDEVFDGFGTLRQILTTALDADAPVHDVYYAWRQTAYRRMITFRDWDQASPNGAWQARVDRMRVELQAEELHQGIVRADYGIPGGISAWQQAEQLAAASLRRMGFPNARVTASGADGGLDVTGGGVAAQVKYTGAAVGRPILQQLVGAAQGARTVCFARSGYSAHGIAYAQREGIALFTIELPDRVTAVNGPATQLARQYR